MNSQFYDSQTGFSQSYLLGRFVKDAQRTQKIPFFIRENRLNSFRWTESFSVILQISRAPSEPFSENSGDDFQGRAVDLNQFATLSAACSLVET